jgi:ATP-dependent Clp protease protease subunit
VSGSRRPGPSTPGRTVEQVQKDIERDKILSAAEAKEYGLIDEVLASRKASFEN